MNTIGIIGGMSPESTVAYYRDINRIVNQAKGGNHSAPIVLASVPFETIVECQKNGDWHKAGELLAEAAQTLERAGAHKRWCWQPIPCTKLPHRLAVRWRFHFCIF